MVRNRSVSGLPLSGTESYAREKGVNNRDLFTRPALSMERNLAHSRVERQKSVRKASVSKKLSEHNDALLMKFNQHT